MSYVAVIRAQPTAVCPKGLPLALSTLLAQVVDDLAMEG